MAKASGAQLTKNVTWDRTFSDLDRQRTHSNLLTEYELSVDVIDEDHKRPWKKVGLAIGLLALGCALMFSGLAVYLGDSQHGIMMMVLGGIVFLPGFFYTRVAYLAWKGRHGYTLDSIPDM